MRPEQNDPRSGGLARGAEFLALSFGASPVRSSDQYGLKDGSICSWRVDLDQYEVPAAPETLIALHTEGPISARGERGWGTAQSLPGTVTVIPPHAEYAIRPLRTIAGRTRPKILGVTTVHLPNTRLVNLLGDGEAEACVATLRMRWGFADPFLSAAVSQLAQAFDAPSERGSLYADALADAVTMHLFREADGHSEPSRVAGGLSPRALRMARDRIETGLASGASLDEIATEVGLSRYHFSRAFKASTGLAPHRYMTLRRIDRAKDLLRGTDTPLIDVALAVGFSSQSHLCDSFRRFVGVSPREYRRSR